MFCHDCRELRDVTVKYIGKYRVALAGSSRLKERKLGHCGKCGGRNVTDWSVGDSCPRCGDVMDNEEFVLFWD